MQEYNIPFTSQKTHSNTQLHSLKTVNSVKTIHKIALSLKYTTDMSLSLSHTHTILDLKFGIGSLGKVKTQDAKYI